MRWNGCLTESTWTPKSESKMLTPKTQLADWLTEGSCTRHEWCILLRLFNIMNFSMFSRSHFRSVEKANTMSKRIPERKTEGEPAVAKPRSVCLISRNLNREQASSFGPDAADVPGDPQLDSGSVQRSCEKLQQDSNPNPVPCSQVWKEDKRLGGVAGNCNEGICVSVQEVAGNCNEGLKSN